MVDEREGRSRQEGMSIDQLDLNMDELDMENNIDLSEIGDDLKRFQEHHLVKTALSQGVDLRQYARDIESDLRDVEKDSIKDYVQEADSLAKLHNQIQACDGILERMESMLNVFQSDLGSISSQIKHLQDESLSMNIKLRNRKAVENQLGTFVEQMVLSPSLITGVSEAEVNTAYLEYVTTLTKHITFSQSSLAQKSRANQDVEPVLAKLKDKALSRIREYLLAKIATLRKPKANVEVVQQTAFLKHKYFYTFLTEHYPSVSSEIRSSYIETVSRVYYNSFKTYIHAIQKLIDVGATKEDLVGASEDVSKSIFTSKHVTRNRDRSVFLLGKRDEIMDDLSATVIVPHAASQAKQRFPLEAVIRSVVQLAMDSATNEAHFLGNFFGSTDDFIPVYQKTITYLLESITSMVNSSYDCIGMMLSGQVLHGLSAIMVRRQCLVLDGLLDKLSGVVWNRFRHVLEMNLASVRSFGVKDDGKLLKDAHPHYVTRRYADLSSSLLLLHERDKRGRGGEMSIEADSVATVLRAMRSEMVELLTTLGKKAFGNDQRMCTITMINNLDLIEGVYSQTSIQTDEFVRHLVDLKGTHVATFLDDQLNTGFGSLIAFVKNTEPLVNESTFEENRKHVSEDTLVTLVQNFEGSWAGGIQTINTTVMKNFPNFKNGVDILKQVLAQLVLYYTRFLEIIKRCYKSPPFARHIVEVDVIMGEIKKYSRSF